SWGPRAAAGAVGVAFGLTAVAGVAMVMREGPSPRRLLVGFFQPLVCCAIMGAVTFGVHELLVGVGWNHPAVLLAAMIVTGAIAYVGSALVICRETAKDLLGLLRKALKRPTPD
ncbi:MAG: polysaccharide biosynthesis C-terminal domain-containing protein, partial [Polyangiales bacterium]